MLRLLGSNGHRARLAGEDVTRVESLGQRATAWRLEVIEQIHSGGFLMEDVIEDFGIMQGRLSVSVGVPRRRINENMHGKRGITAGTVIRLARHPGRDEDIRMNLQSNHELRLERRTLQVEIAAIAPPQST